MDLITGQESCPSSRLDITVPMHAASKTVAAQFLFFLTYCYHISLCKVGMWRQVFILAT
jgi:hypothetical protein